MYNLKLTIGTRVAYCTRLTLSNGVFCLESRFYSFEKASRELALFKIEHDYCEVCRFTCDESDCIIERKDLFITESVTEPVIYFTFLLKNLK